MNRLFKVSCMFRSEMYSTAVAQATYDGRVVLFSAFQF
jgi:hypothetical protein